MSNEDQKAIITLAEGMGALNKGQENIEKRVDQLINDYNDGKEKAQRHAAEVVAVLNEKMDRSEFRQDYKFLIKLNWIGDNVALVLLIIVLLIGAGYLSFGDRFKRTTEAMDQVKKLGSLGKNK